MRQIPLTLQTLYQDLVQAHLDRPVDDLAGMPHLRNVRGKFWWYATVRGPGGVHKQQIIGPDTPEMAARISAWKSGNREARAFRQHASEKSRALRAARMPALDMQTGKTLRALAQAGTFRLGGVLIGTHAFRLYDLELGVSVSADAAATTADIDVAAFEKLSLAIDDYADPELPGVLDGLGFRPLEGRNRAKPVRWRQPGSDFAIDFFSPSIGQGEGPQKLEAFGLWTQGLHFLDFLIREPIPAVALYREGVLLQMPSPERYAVHKLIVASRRRGPGRAKATKDLLQARLMIEALNETRPGAISAAFKEARKEGPAWRDAIDSSLSRSPEIARLLKRG